MNKPTRFVFLTIMAAVLAGCGGGGGSSSSSTSSGTNSATISGTAAAGAPMDGGTIVVRDSIGALVGTTTADSSGNYSINFNPASFTAPFVVTATGNIGGGVETFVSVQPTSPSAGSSSTVNITPATHAIASRVSSTGNPIDLMEKILTEKGNITSSNLNSIEDAFRTFLDSHLSDVGLSSSYNLVSSQFNSKFDKLLDNIKFDVSPNGVITVSSTAGTAINDLGDVETDAGILTSASSSKTAVIPAGRNPNSSDKANIPPLPTNAIAVGVDVLETIRTSLNNCMKISTASRATSATCNQYIIPSYKHDGKTLAQEFGASGSIDFTSVSNDGMVFKVPEILRQIDTTRDAEVLVVRLTGIRTDGTFREIVSIAKNNASGPGTGWKLIGNQRDFDTSIAAAVTKRTSAGGANTPRYESSLNIYVKYSANISYVKITGPELPSGGLFLRRKNGCDFLTITPPKNGVTSVSSVTDLEDPNTTITGGIYNGQTIPCAALYRLQVAKISDGSETLFNTSRWLQAIPQKTHSEVSAINANDIYKFEIFQTGGRPKITYINRLRSKPVLVSEIPKMRFVDFTPATIALLNQNDSSKFYTGGAPPTLAWSLPENTLWPFRATFFHSAGSDDIYFPYGQGGTSIPCTGNTECSGSGPNYINMSSNITATSQYIFQLMTRNRNDLLIFTQMVR